MSGKPFHQEFRKHLVAPERCSMKTTVDAGQPDDWVYSLLATTQQLQLFLHFATAL